MEVKVFDDFYSIIHLVVGLATVLFGLWLFIVFVVYEFVSHFYKRESKEAHFGDVMEYMFGCGSSTLVFMSLGGGI